MINVTKPFLPPKEEYEKYISDIWSRQWLTNNGPLVTELELGLKKFLSVHHLLYVSNGTIAIQIAIKALDLKGEVITTPFSYVATTSSIVWEGCKPVFVDIDPKTLNIDPKKIEAAITAQTSGIVATHVYGNPCDVEAIDAIAKKHNLKVIYDAAHAFGTTYKGKSIYSLGDISTASFHATKLFHTIEGGAVFTEDQSMIDKLSYMRSFGHLGEDYKYIGVNAKNSEFHAAMGLVNLRYVNSILLQRKKLSHYYDEKLNKLPHVKPVIHVDCEYNYSYYPIIMEDEGLLLKISEALQANQIHPRRYFYPSLNKLLYVEPQHMPVSEDISKRVLCLPLYHDLSLQQIDWITTVIVKA